MLFRPRWGYRRHIRQKSVVSFEYKYRLQVRLRVVRIVVAQVNVSDDCYIAAGRIPRDVSLPVLEFSPGLGARDEFVRGRRGEINRPIGIRKL